MMEQMRTARTKIDAWLRIVELEANEELNDREAVTVVTADLVDNSPAVYLLVSLDKGEEYCEGA